MSVLNKNDSSIYSMLPTIGLIAYDGLASHPIVNRITPVSLGISRLEGALVAFRWNDFW
jgi:hypothetical protein